MSEKKWFTVREASAYFGYKPKTFYGFIARNLLPKGSVLRLGHGIRICIEKVENGGFKNERIKR